MGTKDGGIKMTDIDRRGFLGAVAGLAAHAALPAAAEEAELSTASYGMSVVGSDSSCWSHESDWVWVNWTYSAGWVACAVSHDKGKTWETTHCLRGTPGDPAVIELKMRT